MKTRLAAAAAALLFSAAIVTPASAATITYTLSGNFQGTLDGQAFDTFATLTGVGDTNDYDGISVQLASFSALANGITYTATQPISFFNNPSVSIAGFGSVGSDFFDFTGLAGSYAANTPTAPTSVAYASFGIPNGYGSLVTNNGTAVFTGGSNLSFSASLGAVPEPATWGLMILGFGAVGGAMRRRQPIKTSAHFA